LTSTIQWYFCDENAEDLGFGTCFTSNVWLDVPEGDQDLGEVAAAVRTWVNGQAPFPVDGDTPCGTEEQFQQGESLPPTPPVTLNVFGGLQCCGVPDSPFIHFDCGLCPDGAYDVYTVHVEGVGPLPQFSSANGFFTLFYQGECVWQTEVFPFENSPGDHFQYAMVPTPTNLGLGLDINGIAATGEWDSNNVRWDCRSPIAMRFLGWIVAPFTGHPSADIIPGVASAPGLFCGNQGVFMPSVLVVVVANAGTGLLTSVVNQTIPVVQSSRCVYRGTCWFSNRISLIVFQSGTTCEVRFLPGGVIEFAGISPRGGPFFYSTTAPLPWDGSPIALMLDQPVPPFLGLPLSITLSVQANLPF
jgi:hypothetical protein